MTNRLRSSDSVFVTYSVFLALTILASLPSAASRAQSGQSGTPLSSTMGTPDSTCADTGPIRSVGPARISVGSQPPVAVHGLHVRLGPITCYTVTGLELGLIGAAQRIDGVSVGLGNMANEVRGVEVNLLSVGDTRYGIYATGMFLAKIRAAGVSAALFKNIAYRGFGVFAGGWNDADLLGGWMIGVINGSNRTYGLQTGFLNSSLDTNGIQIGIFNRSESLRGIQLGLWNVVSTRSGPFQHLPLLNVGW